MIMGASYGSLLASKVLFGGHSVHLICLPAEADLINSEGFRVRMPIRGRKDPVEIDSRKLPGKVTAGGADSANPGGLRPGRPRHAGAAIPLARRARAARRGRQVARALHVDHEHAAAAPTCAGIPGLDDDTLKPAYTDASVWDNFDPERVTLCSPDPQAIRPPDEKVNVLHGHAADQLQGREVQGRQGHRDARASSRRTSTPSASMRRKARSSCR